MVPQFCVYVNRRTAEPQNRLAHALYPDLVLRNTPHVTTGAASEYFSYKRSSTIRRRRITAV
jgi:hypothetical protein